MGLRFDKEPDIDINVAPSVQKTIRKHIAEIPGVGEFCLGGTISTISEIRAKTYIDGFYKKHDYSAPGDDETERQINMISEVKLYTGQHPGGLLLCPKGEKLTSFTPLMHPDNSESIVSQFSSYTVAESLYKMDIISHSGMELLHMLEELTGIRAEDIQINYDKAMSLLCDTDASEIPNLMEFGNKSVREIIKKTKPGTIEELIKVSALSHGTDVWTGNQEALFETGGISLSECIASRDDIMLTLMNNGMDREEAYTIMESVRKGRGLTQEQQKSMSDYGIPEWYIEVCKKVRYLFPKAHAATYTVMAIRLAYYMAVYPEVYQQALMEAG